MDAKPHCVNTIFCVIFPFSLKFIQNPVLKLNWEFQNYIAMLSYVCPLHCKCVKYRVLCWYLYDIRLYGTLLSVGKAERGFSEHDGKSWHSMVCFIQHGSFFWFQMSETRSLYSFRLEQSVCFFAKHLGLWTFSISSYFLHSLDCLRFLHFRHKLGCEFAVCACQFCS